MRSIRLTLLAGLLAGCNALSAPAAVRATLDEVEALRYDCGEGLADNVPSGLFQWKCSGTVAGHRAIVDVEGNDDGVVGLTLDISSVDPTFTRAEFQRLANSVSLLRAEPGLVGALDTWSGVQNPVRVGAARVNGECDATQCIVFIGFRDGPVQPDSSG